METMIDSILDVTVLEPKLKHPTIFARFDNLLGGESFTIFNDHDPKPLYYQLVGERGEIFSWEYLESGPEFWKVKITKFHEGASEETLGQIVAKDFRKARILKKFGLDFCCGGKKTLKQACADKGVDQTKLEQELQHLEPYSAARQLPYDEWEIDFLADYIVNTHHTYVRKNLPDLSMYANKVMKVHGSHYPELVSVFKLVDEIKAELTSHMMKEEEILFPYIKDLVAFNKNPGSGQAGQFGSVKNPIDVMEMEHESVGRNFEEIHLLTNHFTLPEGACASFTLLYRLLEEFEEDLNLHIHLENNILFPKAIELEKKLSLQNN